MEEQLKKIEKFFDSDFRIKNILLDLAPREVDYYDKESKMKYIDNLLEELKYIKRMLENISQDFGMSIHNNTMILLFDKIFNQIYNFNYNTGDIQKLYEKVLTNMDEELVSEVNKTCVGYTLFNSPTELVGKCRTINELLHVYHSYIVNNEGMYQSMPKLCEPRVNEEGYDINLYGIESELAQKIFDEFPLDMSCGDAEILSLKDRILMMLRDRGHALTIELLDNGDDTISVNYFIPKICNVDMVNKLKGVTKVTKDSKFTRGMFDASKEEITGPLFEFIAGVPMDTDMIFYDEDIMEVIASQQKTQEEQREEQSPDDVIISREDMLEGTKQRKVSKVREIYNRLIARLRGREITNERTRNE